MLEIVGRDEQTGILETLLGRAIGGQGAALVLRGEAGIGKSALLDRAVRAGRDRGMRVLTVTGVPAEVHIAYAGIGLLLGSLHPSAMAASSPYRLAMEILDLLTETATLLVVEDAHWLDAASWETLTFLSRRVESDRIAVLLAVRDGEDIDRRLAAAGLSELRLEALSPGDAGRLLDRTAPGLAAGLRERVLAEAAGNPLGLVELGSAVARSGGSALLPSSLPLSTRVERTFAGLIADLPPLTRSLLLVAALLDGGRLDEILAAATVLTGTPVSADAVRPAVTARLVSVDEWYELRFRHPLLRSALRQQAAPGDRRRVHEALAEMLAGNPQRHLWHRAAASPGPDEALARELTDVAVGAAHQQQAIAVAALDRAIRLSQDPAARGRRQMMACTLARDHGDAETGERILAQVEVGALRPADRARLALIRESFSSKAWSGADQLLGYADLIDGLRRDDSAEPAIDAIAEVALRVYYSDAPAPVLDRFAEVALALREDGDDPRLTGVLLTIDPVGQGADGLRRLRHLAHRTDLPPAWRSDLSIAAWALGAFDLAGALALSSAAETRARGQLGLLALTLNAGAAAQAGLGDARAALPLAAECIALAQETGQPMWALGGGLIAALAEALSGDVAAARRRADVAEQIFTAARRLPMLALVHRARGVAALAEGRADEAFRQLLRVYDPADHGYLPNQRLHLLGHLAEAAMLGGFLDELRTVVAVMEPIAERSQSPSLRVGLGYARAVLTGDYPTALAEDLSDWPFDRARLQLTSGAALRRAFKPTESRPLLRSAAQTFDSLGATPWADRARAELRATGETRRKPTDPLAVLTPQEQQIARLTAEGLSNREIGERLFLSPRTISTHLYRIYPKINVKSRSELTWVFTSSDVL